MYSACSVTMFWILTNLIFSKVLNSIIELVLSLFWVQHAYIQTNMSALARLDNKLSLVLSLTNLLLLDKEHSQPLHCFNTQQPLQRGNKTSLPGENLWNQRSILQTRITSMVPDRELNLDHSRDRPAFYPFGYLLCPLLYNLILINYQLDQRFNLTCYEFIAHITPILNAVIWFISHLGQASLFNREYTFKYVKEFERLIQRDSQPYSFCELFFLEEIG